jgi:hypothetical protein
MRFQMYTLHRIKWSLAIERNGLSSGIVVGLLDPTMRINFQKNYIAEPRYVQPSQLTTAHPPRFHWHDPQYIRLH